MGRREARNNQHVGYETTTTPLPNTTAIPKKPIRPQPAVATRTCVPYACGDVREPAADGCPRMQYVRTR
jgi:hypothetical protein